MNSNAWSKSRCGHRKGDAAARGFTLIELMIVVAIVAILAALAYPAYTNSVLKGKRAEGRTALLGLIEQEERYFTQNNCYVTFSSATDAANCAGALSANPFPLTSGSNPSQAAYNLSAVPCSATIDLRTCVKVQATPNGFTDNAYGILTIQSTGLKACSGPSGGSACWSGT